MRGEGVSGGDFWVPRGDFWVSEGSPEGRGGPGAMRGVTEGRGGPRVPEGFLCVPEERS